MFTFSYILKKGKKKKKKSQINQKGTNGFIILYANQTLTYPTEINKPLMVVFFFFFFFRRWLAEFSGENVHSDETKKKKKQSQQI